MATLSIIPEKFDTGDFAAWLRNFECCATANGWSASDKLKKLPAFLRGQASSYYFSLADGSKETYAALIKNLQKVLCPVVAREQYFAEFENRKLRPTEDPSLFLWELREILAKADPDMGDEAMGILLSRQFLKGLTPELRLRLLEHDPTPTLDKMTTFVQRYRAIHYDNNNPSSICASQCGDAPPQDDLRKSVNQLTAAVAALSANQHQLQETVKEQFKQQQQKPPERPQQWRRNQRPGPRCFNCNQLGHIARDCPWDDHCSLCRGWGHSRLQCANNHIDAAATSAHNLQLNADGAVNRGPPSSGQIMNSMNTNFRPKSSSTNFLRGSGNNKVYNVRHKATGEILTMHVIAKEYRSITRSDSLLHSKSFKVPFVTRLRYTFKTKSRNYLVMDNVDNMRQLSKIFNSLGTFSLDEVIFLSAEIITAISHLHVCCATYKQLCLENVLIDSTGHVQLRRDIFDSSQWAQLECFLCDGSNLCAYHSAAKADQRTVAKDWKDIGNLVCLLLTGEKAFEEKEKSRFSTHEPRYSRPYSLPSTLPVVAADFVESLLQWENNPIPAHLTQSHTLFASIDWYKVVNRQLTPPDKFISTSQDERLNLPRIEITAFQHNKSSSYDYKSQSISPQENNNTLICLENNLGNTENEQILREEPCKHTLEIKQTHSESFLGPAAHEKCPDHCLTYQAICKINSVNKRCLKDKSFTDNDQTDVTFHYRSHFSDKNKKNILYNETEDDGSMLNFDKNDKILIVPCYKSYSPNDPSDISCGNCSEQDAIPCALKSDEQLPDDVSFVTAEALERSWQRRKRNSVKSKYDEQNRTLTQSDAHSNSKSDKLCDRCIPYQLSNTMTYWNSDNDYISQNSKESKVWSLESTNVDLEKYEIDNKNMAKLRSSSLDEQYNPKHNFNLETCSHTEISKAINMPLAKSSTSSISPPEFIRSYSHHGSFVKSKKRNTDFHENCDNSDFTTLERANKLLESNLGDWRKNPPGMSSDFEKSEKNSRNSSIEDIKASVEKAKSLHKRLSKSLQNIRAHDTTISKIPVSVNQRKASYSQKIRNDGGSRELTESNDDIKIFTTDYLNSTWPNDDVFQDEQDPLKQTWPILVSTRNIHSKLQGNTDYDRNNFSLVQKISDGNALQKIKQGAYLQGNRNFNIPTAKKFLCEPLLSPNIQVLSKGPEGEENFAKNNDFIDKISRETTKEHKPPSNFTGKLYPGDATLSNTDDVNEISKVSLKTMSGYKNHDTLCDDLSASKFNFLTEDAAAQQHSFHISEFKNDPKIFIKSENTDNNLKSFESRNSNENCIKRSKAVTEEEIEAVDRNDVFLPNDNYLDFDERNDQGEKHDYILMANTDLISAGPSDCSKDHEMQQNSLSLQASREKTIKLKECNNNDFFEEKPVALVSKKTSNFSENKGSRNVGIKKTERTETSIHQSSDIDKRCLKNFIKVPTVNQPSTKNNNNTTFENLHKHETSVTDKHDIRNAEGLERGELQSSSSSKRLKTPTSCLSKIPVSKKSLRTGTVTVKRPCSLSNKSPADVKMKVLLSPKSICNSNRRLEEERDLKLGSDNNYKGNSKIVTGTASSKSLSNDIDTTDLITKLRVLNEGCRSGKNSPALRRRLSIKDEESIESRKNSVRKMLKPSITTKKPTPDENSVSTSSLLEIHNGKICHDNDIVSRESSIGSASDLWIEEEEKASLRFKRKHFRRSSSGTSGKSNESFEEMRHLNVISPTLTINSSEDDISFQTRDFERASFNSGKSLDSGLSDIFESSREDVFLTAESGQSERGKAVVKSDSGVMKDIEENRLNHSEENHSKHSNDSGSNDQTKMIQCSACYKNCEPDEKSDVDNCCNRCQSKKVERKEAIVELIQTEINYGQDLRILKEEFHTPIKNGGILSPENCTAVFLNLQELIDVNSKLCITLQDDLEECISKSDLDLTSLKVGKVFLDNVEFFQAYEVFCAKQRQALEVVESLTKKSELLKIFLQVSSKQNSKLRKMDLKSFLAMPVQRIMKYPLLLTRIYRATQRDSPDREALISARRNIEEQIARINEITIGRPAKLRKCKSTSALNQSDSSGSHMKKLAAEVLNWKQEETLVIMSGRMEVLSGELIGVTNWNRKSLRKQCSVQAILCAHGVAELASWSTENGLDESVGLPVKSEMTNAAIILLKRKSSSRYTLFKEPILLSQAVIAHRQDVAIAFEVCQITKEALTFLTEDEKSCENWLRNLNYLAKHQGMWRKRRNAMANIMIKSMS